MIFRTRIKFTINMLRSWQKNEGNTNTRRLIAKYKLWLTLTKPALNINQKFLMKKHVQGLSCKIRTQILSQCDIYKLFRIYTSFSS